MKNILAVCILLVTVSIAASAQTPDETTGTEKVKGRGMAIPKQTLIDSLKLSETAADSVVAIREQTMTQMKSIMSDQSLSQEQRREKIKPLKQEMKTRLKQFLTDEQAQKLQEMEMARRQNRGNQ